MSDYSINAEITADNSDFQKKIKQVIAGLDDVSDAFTEMSRDAKQSFASTANQFQAIDAKARLWGDTTDSVARKQKVLRDEINRLIDSGITPESEHIQDLKRAYDTLGDGATASVQKQGSLFADLRDFMQGPIAAMRMLKEAITAVWGSTVGQAQKIEDLTAAFTPLVGGAESAKEMVAALNREAASTPFELEGIGRVAKQLLPVLGNDVKAVTDTFRMIGDTAGGNIEKLDSITRGYVKTMNAGKVSLEALNMISDAGVPIQTQLAKSMGISVSELYKLTSAGAVASDELTKAFQTMTTEGGIFFNGMAVASQTLSGKLSSMSDALKMSGAAIGSVFIPMITKIVDVISSVAGKFVAWATVNDNLKKTLEAVGIVILSVTGALVAFKAAAIATSVVSGLTSVIQKLGLAFTNFGKGVSSVNIIVAVITAVLIPAIILIIKHWDTVVAAIKTGCAFIRYAVEVAADKLQMAFTVAFSSVKVAAMSLAQIIMDKVLGAVSALLSTIGKIPIIGEKFKQASGAVDGFKASIDKSIEASKQESLQAIDTAKKAESAAKERLDTTLVAIETEKNSKKKAVAEEIKGVEDVTETVVVETSAQEDAIIAVSETSVAATETRVEAEKDATVAITESIKETAQIQRTFSEQVKAWWTKTTDDIKENAADWTDTFESIKSAITDGVGAAFMNVGKIIATGSGWDNFKTIALNALASVLEALGSQLIAIGAVKIAMGDLVGGGVALVAGAAAFVAAGAAESAALKDTGKAATETAAAVDTMNESTHETVKSFKELSGILSKSKISSNFDAIKISMANLSKSGIKSASDLFKAMSMSNAIRAYNEALASVNQGIIDTNASIEASKNMYKSYDTMILSTKDSLLSLSKAQEEVYGSLQSVGTDIASKLIGNLQDGLGKVDFMKTMKEYIMNIVIQTAVYTDSLKSRIASIGTSIARAVSGGSGVDMTAIKDQLASIYAEASKSAAAATSVVTSAFSGYATGTDYATAGIHKVGEQGPEFVKIPQGAQVMNARETAAASMGNTITIAPVFNSPKAMNQIEQMRALKQYNRELKFEGVI